MAIVTICGFETGYQGTVGNVSASDAYVNGTGCSREATIVRSGTYAAKVALTSGVAGFWAPLGGTSFTRFYVRVTVRPSSTARLLYGDSGANAVNLRLNPNGTLAYYLATTLKGTSTTALTDTTKWYRIGVRGGTATSVPVLTIDGVTEVTDSPSAWTLVSQFGANDTVADTYTAYFDDVTWDDAAIPGEGKVVLLLPTSVNAAGGWVEGDGAGTAGMAAAVATRPPPGVASASETASTNIESPTNSATDNCDMNMTTYTAAGIAAGDTINAVQAVVSGGEDIATGTKSGAVKIVSNPTQSGEDILSVGFGLDSGAHGAHDGNATTDKWSWDRGVAQVSPSVTKGTAPVLRVGKRTATTRVVCVDFMGIYVDYTPAGAGAPPFSRPFPRAMLAR